MVTVLEVVPDPHRVRPKDAEASRRRPAAIEVADRRWILVDDLVEADPVPAGVR